MRKLAMTIIAMVVMMAMTVGAYADGMTADKAKNIAFKDAGLNASQVKALEVDYDDEDKVWEVEFKGKRNKNEYDYDIASSGLIVKKSIDYKYKKNKSKKKIGKKKARQKVAKASGISYKVIKKGSCKYKYKERKGEYTIKFRKGHYKYEYEVLAPNGKIIEMEYKYVK